MMTAAGEGSDRSMSRQPGKPSSDFRVARAFGGGVSEAATASPSGRVRIHERIAAIIQDLNKYGPTLVDRAAHEAGGSAASSARRDLSEALSHLKHAETAVKKLHG